MMVYPLLCSMCTRLLHTSGVRRHPLICRFLHGARRLRQTASSFLGSFCSPGRVIRGPIRATGVIVSDSQGGSVIRINLIKKGRTFAGLVSCPILSRLCPWTGLGHIAPKSFDSAHLVILLAFSSLPFELPEQETLHLLSPIRALTIYVDSSGLRHKSY